MIREIVAVRGNVLSSRSPLAVSLVGDNGPR